MAVDLALLEEQCAHTLDRADFGGVGVRRIEGKVRDNYVRGERRAIVVTDRVSAFDVGICTIPFKGQVLNQLAAFWFERTAPKLLVDAIGADNLLFETDFPHPTCLYPNVREHLAEVTADWSEATLRKILQDNAAKLYKVDLGVAPDRSARA